MGSLWIPGSSEVYRGYNLRTPGTVSSAACIASKSVAGNEASARAKKTSLKTYREGIVSTERAGECGFAKYLATTHTRLALCSAVRHCACSALCSRVLMSVRCGAVLVRECCTLSMCTSLLRTGHAECMITEESNYLPSLTGVIMHSPDRFSSDNPGVAREGPEATPLTSLASTF